jgi:excisionase family DNA binding protein
MQEQDGNVITRPRYLGLRQAASYACLSTSTLQRAVRAGRLRALRPVGNRLVFEVEAIDEFLHGPEQKEENQS